MTPELRLSAADHAQALCDGECPVASDCLLNGPARSGEILAVVGLARADVGEDGFGVGHGEAVLEPLDANGVEERLELFRAGFESEGLGVVREVPAGDESIELGKVPSPDRRGVEGASRDPRVPRARGAPRRSSRLRSRRA
jgi:hypothetical protein